MNKPYWFVVNIGSGEEILQISCNQFPDNQNNRDTVKRMVAQWFEEDWEDCKDGVEIKLIK